MTDEIRKVIADAADLSESMGNEVANDIITALHAAGYEIEPKWSDDLSKAPRDGTPVEVWGGNWIDEDDTHCQFGGSYPIEWPTVVFWCVDKWTDGRRSPRIYRPTHWCPRPSPPKEAE